MNNRRIQLPDGCFFEGHIDHDGLRQGRGKKYYKNGATFEGLYKDDKRHGAGIKTCANGTTVMVEYRNGKLVWSLNDL